MTKKALIGLAIAVVQWLPLFARENPRGERIEGDVFKKENMGLSARLPKGEWFAKDTSQGAAQVFTLTNTAWKDFHLVFVMMPSAVGIRTAEDRNVQLSNHFGDKYEKIAIQRGRIDDRETSVLVFNYKGEKANQRNLSHVIVIGDQTYLIQVSGPESEWEANHKKINALLLGVSFFERKIAEPRGQVAGGKEIKAAEPEAIKSTGRILHHSLRLRIDPRTGGLTVRDTFRAKIVEDKVGQMEFYLSRMDVDSIQSQGKDLEHSLQPFQDDTKKLVITLARAHNSGEEVMLEYAAHKDEFLFSADDKLIAGYNIFGQVRKDSSYTSHVIYYPLDEENAASGEVWITVPRGYTAVGVGKLVEVKTEGEYDTFHWKTDVAIPRMLPFAFAVAEYERYSAQSGSGVSVELYTWKEFEKHALERIGIIKEIIDFETRLYGEFPFEKIAFIHVIPKQGLAGVSLPTMILLSDMFFKSNVSLDLIKDSVQGAMNGPLVLSDEMSHQWNAYAVVFPNELAEGMAQYTDTLFAEHVGGKDVLKKHMEYYFGLYKAAVAVHPDQPISSKEIYQTEAYSSIAFCKGAMVLNMLRYVVGDERFFQAFRNIFETNFGKKASLDTLREGMEAANGGPLDWFFNQWYHRAGYPRYEVTLERPESLAAKDEVAVLVKQTQQGDFFRMPVDITFTAGHLEKTFEKVMIDDREKRLTFKLDFVPEKVVLDKSMWLLKEAVQADVLSPRDLRWRTWPARKS